jgi:hypothetical protein
MTRATVTRTGRRRTVRLAVVALIVVAASSVGVQTTSATHAPLLRSGDWRINQDLNCTSRQVKASTPILRGEPANLAWTIPALYGYVDTGWQLLAYGSYRWSYVNGLGSAGPIWTDYDTGAPATASYFTTAPGAYYAVLDWVYYGGDWQATWAIDYTGYSVCLAA